MTKLRFYAAGTEQEQRLTIPKTLYDTLVAKGSILECNVCTITQYWLDVVNKPMRMRIRHTRDITGPFHKDNYEHTIKYPVGDGVDLEVSSELTSAQYDLIKSLVQDKSKDKKIRKTLTLTDSALNGDYTITADFKSEWPDYVFIEFEAKKSSATPFELPECFKGEC